MNYLIFYITHKTKKMAPLGFGASPWPGQDNFYHCAMRLNRERDANAPFAWQYKVLVSIDKRLVF